MANKETTADIPSSGGSDEHALTDNTSIIVFGASGDLAKKKVGSIHSAVLHCTLSRSPDSPSQRCAGEGGRSRAGRLLERGKGEADPEVVCADFPCAVWIVL